MSVRYWTVNQLSRSIVLIGMMGAGKSCVGGCLHRRTGLALLDTDEIVASNFRMSIPQIFAEHGEKKFREAETEALRGVRTEEQKIIVTGGGVVLRKANIEILMKQGVIVWLDGDEDRLFARASRKQNRPLLQTKNPRQAFSQILDARRALYGKIADIRIDTSILTDEEVAVAILAKLRRMNPKPESSIPAKT
ncbi:MAG TPA: shikimate kinase [Candidatus Udaeobacter sp.]